MVTILLPNYKTPELTKLCIRSLRKYTDLSRIRVIAIDSASQEVALFFRVGSVADNAVLTVKCGDKVLLTKKKRRMTPGEMESVRLSAKLLAEAEGELTVSVD